jgi:hypothetical protein
VDFEAPCASQVFLSSKLIAVLASVGEDEHSCKAIVVNLVSVRCGFQLIVYGMVRCA